MKDAFALVRLRALFVTGLCLVPAIHHGAAAGQGAAAKPALHPAAAPSGWLGCPYRPRAASRCDRGSARVAVAAADCRRGSETSARPVDGIVHAELT